MFVYFVPTELAAGTRPPNALGVDHHPVPTPYESKVQPRLDDHDGGTSNPE